jgi:transcriptional regulator with XRE-family HTH domain
MGRTKAIPPMTADIMAAVRGRIVTAMREAGITRHGLSELSGVGYPIIWEIVQGERRDIYLSTLVRIADALGLTVSQLVR